MFLIKIIGEPIDEAYYTGKKYISQGCGYAVLSSRDEAKKYTTRARAERAAISLANSCAYCGNYEIELNKEGDFSGVEEKD